LLARKVVMRKTRTVDLPAAQTTVVEMTAEEATTVEVEMTVDLLADQTAMKTMTAVVVEMTADLLADQTATTTKTMTVAVEMATATPAATPMETVAHLAVAQPSTKSK
jgi:hypothetical protein